jgi:SAM-dependent methyltransferase
LILVLLDGNLHLAPIGSHPQRVLDIGTGTGAWAIDFADQYPSAEVIANDLAPIQPTSVPPNLRFLIDDIEASWNYEREPFDYVHARYLAASIKDWPKLVSQAFACIKPGGWVEFQDWNSHIYSADDSIPHDRMLYKYHDFTCYRRDDAGYNTQPGPELESWVRDAGFINVQAYKFIIPMGTWPKEKKFKQVGAYNLLQFQQGMEGIAIGCLKDSKLHGQYDFYVVYGQKPLTAEST